MTNGPNGHDSVEAPTDPTVNKPLEPTLADVLDDLVGDFADVVQQPVPGGVDYLVGRQAFVRQEGTVAHFRLRPEIVAAAARTGDASVSALGHEWIAFSPRRFDQYALDRAQAWFELAHRLASTGSQGNKH